MSKNFYISDLHYGHQNVLKFDQRPFSSIEKMEEQMIILWNETVTKKDMVYILGDFCWGKEEEWNRILNKLNGNKTLLKGNHCLKQMSSKLKNKFSDIKDYKEITDNGKKIIMSHYPIMCYKGSYNDNNWMFHGHTHETKEQKLIETWTQQLVDNYKEVPDNRGHIVNVGCMMPYVNYIPRTADELIKAWEDKYVKKGIDK